MYLQEITTFLGWSTVINFAVLLFTTLMLIAFRSAVSSIHGRLFGLDEKDLGRAYFQYLSHYKIAIIVFNLAPYLALRIMG